MVFLEVEVLSGVRTDPHPSHCHSNVVIGGMAYVYAGILDSKTPHSKLRRFDPERKAWQVLGVLGTDLPARDGHAAFANNDYMYIFAGLEDSVSPSSTVYRTHLAGGSQQVGYRWEQLGTSGRFMPPPREGAAVTCHDSTIYVFGGNGGNTFLGDFWSLDLKAEKYQWNEIKTGGPSPGPRDCATLVPVGDKLYLYGGEPTEREAYHPLWVFDPRNETWQCITTFNGGCQPPQVSCHSCCYHEKTHTLFVLFGSYVPVVDQVELSNSIFALNIATNTWYEPQLVNPDTSEFPAANNSHRFAPSSCLIGDHIYVFGGSDDDGYMVQDALSLRVASPTVTKTPDIASIEPQMGTAPDASVTQLADVALPQYTLLGSGGAPPTKLTLETLHEVLKQVPVQTGPMKEIITGEKGQTIASVKLPRLRDLSGETLQITLGNKNELGYQFTCSVDERSLEGVLYAPFTDLDGDVAQSITEQLSKEGAKIFRKSAPEGSGQAGTGTQTRADMEGLKQSVAQLQAENQKLKDRLQVAIMSPANTAAVVASALTSAAPAAQSVPAQPPPVHTDVGQRPAPVPMDISPSVPPTQTPTAITTPTQQQPAPSANPAIVATGPDLSSQASGNKRPRGRGMPMPTSKRAPSSLHARYGQDSDDD
eukprot:GFYU01011724.1.p1 GENE.GFYU01011724.1~~GFYU01011724.1.p1  ORF type:complete len:649 (+),score=91.86 GFYU01011724.1:68-2014(+)